MADPGKHDSTAESLIHKMMRIRSNDDSDSSSSDSDDDYRTKLSASDVKSRGYRLFGREGSVHKILGGGKVADILLWKEQKVSAGVLGAATAVWVLFELLDYHLLSLVCHILMLLQVTIFLMTNVSSFLNKPRPKIPEVTIPLDMVLKIASAFRIEFNGAFATVQDIASGRDVKKFLAVIVILSILSVLGNCFSFLTLCYLGVVFLLTVPMLYEKNEDQIDAFAEKAEAVLRKQYTVLNDKVLSKIPKGPLKDKFQ